ncbi:hypothetical protein [Telluribacter sp. SYSU D00476]|uniref:hypothetical protein n=1 Tax=Telluribacter sp. SYSU D00476 TaxID=2811430 RepID=UPI001FF4CBB4|nr:hypothetical protein [Telluribacter sp. SYSU D00476]
MKKHLIVKIAILAALVAGTCGFGRTEVEGLNETSVLLNGKPLYAASLSVGSRGTLAVVVADPETDEAVKIPFRIYVKRGTAVVSLTGSDFGQPLREVELGKILAHAQAGDELVIEPTEKSQIEARRVIRVNGFPFCNWLLLRNKTGDGC